MENLRNIYSSLADCLVIYFSVPKAEEIVSSMSERIEFLNPKEDMLLFFSMMKLLLASWLNKCTLFSIRMLF